MGEVIAIGRTIVITGRNWISVNDSRGPIGHLLPAQIAGLSASVGGYLKSERAGLRRHCDRGLGGRAGSKGSIAGVVSPDVIAAARQESDTPRSRTTGESKRKLLLRTDERTVRHDRHIA